MTDLPPTARAALERVKAKIFEAEAIGDIAMYHGSRINEYLELLAAELVAELVAALTPSPPEDVAKGIRELKASNIFESDEPTLQGLTESITKKIHSAIDRAAAICLGALGELEALVRESEALLTHAARSDEDGSCAICDRLPDADEGIEHTPECLISRLRGALPTPPAGDK